MKHILFPLLLLACPIMLKAQPNTFNSNDLLTFRKNPHLKNADFFIIEGNLIPKHSTVNNWKYNTFYAYDKLGNLNMILNIDIDPANHTYTSTYKKCQSGVWIDNIFHSQTYNSEGNIVSYIYEHLEDYGRNKLLFNYQYDKDQNLLSEQYESYINNICQGKNNIIYTYNENQKIQYADTWSWHNEQWNKVSTETYTYDSIGNLKERKSKNLTTNIYYSKYSYTYDTIGRIITECHEGIRNSVLEKQYFCEFSYDDYGNTSTRLWEYWYDNKCLSWYKDKYAYDSEKNIIADTLECWYNYKNSSTESLTTFTYNSNNDLLSELVWFKDNNGTWNENERCCYTYDLQGNSLNGIHEIFYDNHWQLIDGMLQIFMDGTESYSISGSRYEALKVPIPENPAEIFIYPNPSKGVFCLEINKSYDNTYNLKIINSLNQIVYQVEKNGDNKLLINLPNLASGIYFIHLTINDKDYMEKMIIQKNM